MAHWKERDPLSDRAHSRVNEMAMRDRPTSNRNMGKLRRTITALAAMCSEVPWADPLEFTDSAWKSWRRCRSKWPLGRCESSGDMGFLI